MYDVMKFLHVLTVVFMAAPLYNLIVVNERAKFGKAHIQVDRYFESLIRGNATRCYVFQVTALVTGVLLVGLGGSLVGKGGSILACGTCLKIRESEGSEMCPLSTMKDLYEIVKESDRVVTF